MNSYTIPSNYSNQRFYEQQQRAAELTDKDRRAGQEAPRYGYSAKNWTIAEIEYEAALARFWGREVRA